VKRKKAKYPPSKGELPPREKLPLPIGMSTCLVIASPIAFHSSVSYEFSTKSSIFGRTAPPSIRHGATTFVTPPRALLGASLTASLDTARFREFDRETRQRLWRSVRSELTPSLIGPFVYEIPHLLNSAKSPPALHIRPLLIFLKSSAAQISLCSSMSALLKQCADNQATP
jgi:hypothetical protein